MKAHDPRARPRAARHRRPRDRLRDEAHRRRVTCSSTSPTRARAFVKERFPNIYAECLQLRHRHHARSRSRSSPRRTIMCGGVIDRSRRAHDDPGPLGHRRVRVHRPPRRQPPRVELAPRGARLRPPRRGDRRASDDRPAAAVAGRARLGRRRGRRRATRPSSSRRTGTSSAASCGTTSASCARTSASAAPRAASRSSRRRSASTTGSYLVTRDLLELRNIATVAAAHRRVRVGAAREPRPPLHHRLPRARSRSAARDIVVKRGVPAHLRGR